MSATRPIELNLLVAVSTTDGHVGDRYSVKLAEDVSAWAWTNTHRVTINGMIGTIDTAVFYHPAHDEPLMKMRLDLQANVGPADSISFDPGSIRLSADAISLFQWPPEDYLINELEEP
jgi:hypothetical protein